MNTYSVTVLRKQLDRVIDQVLETGVPVEIERNGQKLLLIPTQKTVSKLANLSQRRGIVGDPEDLVQLKVDKWNTSNNLD